MDPKRITSKAKDDRNFYIGRNKLGIYKVEVAGATVRMRGALYKRYTKRDAKTGELVQKRKLLNTTTGYVRPSTGEQSLVLYSRSGHESFRLIGIRASALSLKVPEKKAPDVEPVQNSAVMHPSAEKERALQAKLKREYAAMRLQVNAGDDPKITLELVRMITGRSRATIYRDVKAAKLRTIKLGHSIRFSYAEVVAYLNGVASTTKSAASSV
jgi:predicted DNA-binding transcriptional regulator AlpA